MHSNCHRLFSLCPLFHFCRKWGVRHSPTFPYHGTGHGVGLQSVYTHNPLTSPTDVFHWEIFADLPKYNNFNINMATISNFCALHVHLFPFAYPTFFLAFPLSSPPKIVMLMLATGDFGIVSLNNSPLRYVKIIKKSFFLTSTCFNLNIHI